MSRAISLTITYPVIEVTVRCSVGGVERQGVEQKFTVNPGDNAAIVKTLLNNTLVSRGMDVIDNSWNFVAGIVAQVQTASVNAAFATLNPTYAPLLAAAAGQTL